MAVDYRGAARALLPDLRNELDITWTDSALDAKIEGWAAQGMALLDAAAGAEQDYHRDTLARALLMDYARYRRSGADSEFLGNYHREILMLRQRQEVASYADADL